ncbi:cache domain-containing sensor histidine kinase [Aneurinibacillus sp. REN35]|uniref:cache domain-containing sensor histidine kinase n=1 Tax=Aneurinibacillus sp. REN35 TaxID=3237286 RepID=UPI003528240B
MKGKWPHLSFRQSLLTKFVFAFVAFLSIPILVFQFLLFHSWMDTSVALVVKQHEVNLYYIKQKIERTLHAIEEENDTLYKMTGNEAFLFAEIGKVETIEQLRGNPYVLDALDRVKNQLFDQSPGKNVYSFLSMDGQLLYQRTDMSSLILKGAQKKSYKQEAWFQEVVARGAANTVLPAHASFFVSDDSRRYLSFAQVLRNPYTLESIGISMIDVDLTLFDSLVQDITTSPYIGVEIVGSDGHLLYSRNVEQAGDRSADYVEMAEEIRPYGWQLKGKVMKNILIDYYQASLIQNNMIVIIATLILLGCFVLFLSRRLSPLSQLAEMMNKAKQGNFKVRIQMDGRDEFKVLIATFNEMTTEIERLFQEKEKVYQEKLKYELTSMEKIINPHFMYNTLDVIQYKAADEDTDTVCDMIISLSTIMRYTVERFDERVNWREEVQWLTDYLYLQKQLYEERVTCHLLIDEEVLRFTTRKLMLQPFVENAFIHGFENKLEDGLLFIKGWVEADCLVFRIEDNGKGFSKRVAWRLTRDTIDLVKPLGFGMYVTAQRFLLEDANNVIVINSEPEHGTTIELRQRIYE